MPTSYFTAVILSLLSAPQGAFAIFGGSSVKCGERPYAINIHYDGQDWCGGALISPRHAITAAHCVVSWSDGSPRQPAEAVVRSYTCNNGEEWREGPVYPVKQIHIHPDYDYKKRSDHFDIAIFEFMDPVKYHPFRSSPVPLPNSATPQINDYVTVIGSGDLDKTQARGKNLLSLETEVITNEECQRIWKKHHVKYYGVPPDSPLPPIHEHHFCVVDYATRGMACHGDSGSAMLRNGAQVGVLSGSPGECSIQPNENFGTRITDFIQWIQTTVGSHQIRWHSP